MRPGIDFCSPSHSTGCFISSFVTDGLLDRHGRRHHFSNWMKRLAHLKNSSSESNSTGPSNKSDNACTPPKGKKNTSKKNNPYPLSGTVGAHVNPSRHEGVSLSDASERYVHSSRSHSESSIPGSGYDNQVPMTGVKSTAPTLSTNGDTTLSEAANSKAGTMATTGGGLSCVGGGEGSTFSSPAPSVRSLTTTLTTVQSAAPSAQIYGVQSGHPNGGGLPHTNGQQVQFSHQFPSSPASAVPSYMASHSHPVTYSTAVANNILTDNASILTLASSSKRRRRNSLDTNASIRALAPSSIFGGSRESLPLSVLSGNIGEPSNASAVNASSVLSRPSMGGLGNPERGSMYSASGIGPLTSGGERSSLYTSKQSSGLGDNGSVRSGIHSHIRNDSTTGSMGGPASSAVGATGRVSRQNSGWGELTGDDDEAITESPKRDDDIDMVAQVSHIAKDGSHDAEH